MPGGDRSGPSGLGPMTGRGAGYCGSPGQPGFFNRFVGFGAGFGRWFNCLGNQGGGRGWRNRFYATGQPDWTRYSDITQATEQESDMLKTQAELLKTQLENIQKRLDELENH